MYHLFSVTRQGYGARDKILGLRTVSLIAQMVLTLIPSMSRRDRMQRRRAATIMKTPEHSRTPIPSFRPILSFTVHNSGRGMHTSTKSVLSGRVSQMPLKKRGFLKDSTVAPGEGESICINLRHVKHHKSHIVWHRQGATVF